MRPPWLLNENIPRPAVSRVRAAGWGVAVVAESGASAADPQVLARARAEARWPAIFDRDDGELVFRRALAPPRILLLRVPS